MTAAHTLIYHDVVAPDHADESGFLGADAAHYKLSPAVFDEHLRAIREAGVRPLSTLAEVGRARSALLTFDDGGSSALSTTAPRLEAEGLRGVFLITTDRIGTPSFVTAEDVRELDRRGHIIGTHSASHPDRFSFLTPSAMEKEWRTSMRVLEEILGKSTTVGSVPGGYYSRAVGESAATVGLDVLFNSEPTSGWTRLGTTWIAGRYSVTRKTSPSNAAALARGGLRATLKQRATWETKKVVKAALGTAWLEARRRLFRAMQ